MYCSNKYFIGEIALLMNCKRTANVRAKTFCELCTLSRKIFDSVADRYTDDRAIMEEVILEKYDDSFLKLVNIGRGTHRNRTNTDAMLQQSSKVEEKVLKLTEQQEIILEKIGDIGTYVHAVGMKVNNISEMDKGFTQSIQTLSEVVAESVMKKIQSLGDSHLDKEENEVQNETDQQGVTSTTEQMSSDDHKQEVSTVVETSPRHTSKS